MRLTINRPQFRFGHQESDGRLIPVTRVNPKEVHFDHFIRTNPTGATIKSSNPGDDELLKAPEQYAIFIPKKHLAFPELFGRDGFWASIFPQASTPSLGRPSPPGTHSFTHQAARVYQLIPNQQRAHYDLVSTPIQGTLITYGPDETTLFSLLPVDKNLIANRNVPEGFAKARHAFVEQFQEAFRKACLRQERE